MILWIRDRFRNLSHYHYAVIVLTIFVPVILGLVVAYPAFECLLVRVIVYVALFLVWALFVVIVVALVVERDAAVVNRLVSQHADPLGEQVNRLKEEHDGLIADVRLQVEDLESRTRATFETLDVDLPPKTVYLRGAMTAGASISSATLNVSGGSRWGPLRQRFRRAMRKTWEVVYGKRQRG